MRTLFASFLFLAALSVFAASLWAMRQKAHATAADVLGGQQVVEIIQQADKVEVFRLKDQYEQPKLDAYTVVAGPATIDARLAAELAHVVSAHGSYEREASKGCVPIYGVKATFVRGQSQADVLFCFGCQTLQVHLDGKSVAWANFEPALTPLTKIVQQAFPDDEAIQQIGK